MKWIFLIAIALVLVIGGSALLARAGDARVAVSELIGESESDATEQGGSQISHLEFLGIRPGTARGAIEALVGEPESRHETKIEGLAIECWYYGVAGATGSYQLCFADGRLRTKSAYGMR